MELTGEESLMDIRQMLPKDEEIDPAMAGIESDVPHIFWGPDLSRHRSQYYRIRQL